MARDEDGGAARDMEVREKGLRMHNMQSLAGAGIGKSTWHMHLDTLQRKQCKKKADIGPLTDMLSSHPVPSYQPWIRARPGAAGLGL